MNIKLLPAVLLFFCFPFLFSQKKPPFGQLSVSEKNFSRYEQDSSAMAIVLYERGDNYFEVINKRIQLVKKYHVKIKILDEKGFSEADISIPFYHNDTMSEKVMEIKAITHNGYAKTVLSANEIYTKDVAERWSEKTFAFPNVKKNSILEYTYTLISPFIYNLNGWTFQSRIPKLYSEFNAKIPGNYVYNRTLTGSLKLEINDASLKKNCFHVPGTSTDASCEVLKYAMNNIPAFKEEEGFMLSSSNYISRLVFELSELYNLNGSKNKFTKTWKDVDHEFRTDKDIGRQLTKKGFFEKNIPEELLVEGDELTRAKNIYSFVQNHFTWNNKYGIYRHIRVKDAFNQKKGNIGEINISLINLLNTAGIKTNLMLLSTRQNGLPKRTHPVISDFNYVIAKVEIEGKNYLLDASDKYNPFGMLPFRCLNYYGRVMDFKNESYWYDIEPVKINKHQIRARIEFNIDEQKGYGIFYVSKQGYDAVSARKLRDQNSEEEYLESIENDIKGDFHITGYELVKERNNEKMTSERFEFELENVLNGEMVYFNPFLVRFFEKNPFLLEERNYPIDFGYPRNYRYQISIIVPEGYIVKEIPENKMIDLGEKKATLRFYCTQSWGQIAIAFDLAMNTTHFAANDYGALKELFKYVTDTQGNSLVILKKE